MNTPVCYILIGPPAAGKSTWRAAHLAKADLDGRTTVTLSSDDYLENFALTEGITYDEAFRRADFKAIERAMRADFGAATADGLDIISDRTNMTIKSRNKTLAMLPRSYRRVGVIFSVPRDELNRRLFARAAATGKSIPPKTIDQMIASYQEPLSTEFNQIIRV